MLIDSASGTIRMPPVLAVYFSATRLTWCPTRFALLNCRLMNKRTPYTALRIVRESVGACADCEFREFVLVAKCEDGDGILTAIGSEDQVCVSGQQRP